MAPLRSQPRPPPGEKKVTASPRHGDQETTTKYYYAGGFLVARRVDGVATWVHQDHLDSLRAISDGAGAGIATREFAAFGEQVGSTGTDSGTRGYGAHWQDGESGLLYMGARYYDPVLARFVQPDSVVPEPGDPQSWNRYSFVRNNPYNRVDPTGSFDIGAEIGGRLVEFLGGNRTGGEFFGSLSSGLVPGFGELADAGVLFSLDHRVGTGVRLVAAGSLALSVVTLGTSPNVGGVVRQADDVVEAGAAGVRAIAKSGRGAAEGAGAARETSRLGRTSDDVIHVTPDRVALPPGSKYKIPEGLVENPNRPGSYGEAVGGKFREQLRIDAPTPAGRKGPDYSHYHLEGGRRHYSPRPEDPDPGFPR